jgi:hypothetical protein
MNEFSNSSATSVDLSEVSLEDIIKKMVVDKNTAYAVRPKRLLLPPWVVKEIETDYGAPATEAKYHQWNMKRLNLKEDEYFKRLAIDSFRE